MREVVTLDALGTMVHLPPPWEKAPAELTRGLPPDLVRDAFVAEMTYYRSNIGRGRDRESLAALRRDCAVVLADRLGRPVSVEQMMDSLRFELYPDVRGALEELDRLGLRLACVSNWDCSLPDVLRGLGIDYLLEIVITSATAGAMKPDPAIFTAALEALGCAPTAALHVGDTTEDIEGARAAGIAALRIDRGGGGDIGSLRDIRQHL